MKQAAKKEKKNIEDIEKKPENGPERAS